MKQNTSIIIATIIIVSMITMFINGCKEEKAVASVTQEVMCDNATVVSTVLELYDTQARHDAAEYYIQNPPEEFTEEEKDQNREYTYGDKDLNDLSDEVKEFLRTLELSLRMIRTDSYNKDVEKKECRAKLTFNNEAEKDIYYNVQKTTDGTVVEVYE